MSNAMNVVEPENDESFIRKMICKDATDNEYQMFKYFCKTKGVHPLDKKILFVKRKENVSYQASIDYLRQVADSSGTYNGQDEAVFKIRPDSPYPAMAKVAVYRKGIDRPFVGVAYWEEYYPGEGLSGFFWRKMPFHMLAKCAEALALRKAFPGLLDRIYTPEEMGQERTAAEMSVPVSSNKTEYRGLDFTEIPTAKPDSTSSVPEPLKLKSDVGMPHKEIIDALSDAFEGKEVKGKASVRITGAFRRDGAHYPFRIATVIVAKGSVVPNSEQDYFTDASVRASLAKTIMTSSKPDIITENALIEYVIKNVGGEGIRVISTLTPITEKEVS